MIVRSISHVVSFGSDLYSTVDAQLLKNTFLKYIHVCKLVITQKKTKKKIQLTNLIFVQRWTQPWMREAVSKVTTKRASEREIKLNNGVYSGLSNILHLKKDYKKLRDGISFRNSPQ